MADNELPPNPGMVTRNERQDRQSSKAGIFSTIILEKIRESVAEQEAIGELQLEELNKLRISFDKYFKWVATESLQAKSKGLDGVGNENSVTALDKDAGEVSSGPGFAARLPTLKELMAAALVAVPAAYGFTTLDSFKKWTNRMIVTPMQGVVKGFDKAVVNIKETFKTFPDNLKTWSKDLIKDIKFKFDLGVQKFQSTELGKGIAQVWEGVKTKIGLMKAAIVGWYTKNILNPIDKSIKWFEEKLGKGEGKGAGEAAKPAGPPKKGSITWVMDKIKSGWNLLKNSFVGRILGFLGKILYPIALVFSTLDGVNEWQKQYKDNPDDPELAKQIEGVTGFIAGFTGSFLGGFVNAVKGVMLWAIKKMFPDSVDENGNFKTDSFVGKMLSEVAQFDAAKFLTDTINGVYELFRSVIIYIKDKFMKVAELLGFGQTDEELSDVAKMNAQQGKGYMPPVFDALEQEMIENPVVGGYSLMTNDQINARAKRIADMLDMEEKDIKLAMMQRRYEEKAMGVENMYKMTRGMSIKKTDLDQAVAAQGQIKRDNAAKPIVVAPQTNVTSSTQNNDTKVLNVPLTPGAAGNSIQPWLPDTF